MPRKTMPVRELLNQVNRLLLMPDENIARVNTPAESITHAAKSARMVLASLIEATLMNTGNYAGFGYQASELVGDGTLRKGYDDTRRIYYGR